MAKRSRPSAGSSAKPRKSRASATPSDAEATDTTTAAEAAGTAAAQQPDASAKSRRKRRPKDARALADQVFAQLDPVELACALLRNEEQPKNAGVKARVWEKLVEYRFGRPAPMSDSSDDDGPCIVLDVPRPAREYEEE
jgi:hypothetical protein